MFETTKTKTTAMNSPNSRQPESGHASGYMPRTYWIIRQHHITGESQEVAESAAPVAESDYPAQRRLLDQLRETCLKIGGDYTGNYSFIAGEWGYHMVVCIESLVNRKA